MERRLCLITGASSGIGAAFAEVFAAKGWDVALTGRDEARLNGVATRVRETYGREATVIVADLADPRSARRLVGAIDRPIDGLVNNAGYAPGPDFFGTPWIDHLAFLQTLLAAPTELAHRLGPDMKKRGFGRIINVASVIGLMPAAGEGSLYGPVKAYMIRLSEALHAQLEGTGVHVTGLCPGFTRTEIFARAGNADVASTVPDAFWQDAAAVAAYGYDACERNRVIAVSGAPNKVQAALMKYLPARVARSLVRQAGKRVVPD